MSIPTFQVRLQKVGGQSAGLWLSMKKWGCAPEAEASTFDFTLQSETPNSLPKNNFSLVCDGVPLPFDRLLNMFHSGYVDTRTVVDNEFISGWEQIDGTAFLCGRVWDDIFHENAKLFTNAFDEYGGLSPLVEPLPADADWEHTPGKLTQLSEPVTVQFYVQEGGRWSPIAFSELRMRSNPREITFEGKLESPTADDPVLGKYQRGGHVTFDPALTLSMTGTEDAGLYYGFTASMWLRITEPPAGVLNVMQGPGWNLAIENHKDKNWPYHDWHFISSYGNKGPRSYPHNWFGPWAHFSLVSDGRGTLGMYLNGQLICRDSQLDAPIYYNPSADAVLTIAPTVEVAKPVIYAHILLGTRILEQLIEADNPGFLRSAKLLSAPLAQIDDSGTVRTTPTAEPFVSRVLGGVEAVADDLLKRAFRFHDPKADVVALGIVAPLSGMVDRMLLTLWCNPDPVRNGPTAILSWPASPAKAPSFSMSIDATGRLLVQFLSSTEHRSLESKSPLPVGGWTHVALVSDGKTAALYYNGKLETSVPNSGPAAWLGPFSALGGARKLVDGSDAGGFVGSLTRLEITSNFDPAAPMESLLAAKIDADLGPVAVGVGGPIPLEFTIRNSNDEPALLLEDKDQSLTIELRNTSAHTISLPDPRTGHAIELRFRPGTLHDPKNIKTGPPEQTSPGGAWTVAYVSEADATDTLLLHTAAAAELKPGETVRIPLLGLRPDRANGARTTRIQLRYHLSYGDRYPLEGSRIHALSLIYPLSTGAEGELVELSAVIVGDDAVFCDGTTNNSLTIRVFNLSPFPLEISATSQLRLYIDCVNDGHGAPLEHANRPTALFCTEDEGSINQGLTVSTNGWAVGAVMPFVRVIEAKSAKSLGQAGATNSFVEFKLNAFKCNGVPGAGELRIEFLNIGKKNRHGERPTGIVSVPVRRVNALATASGETLAKGNLTLSNFNKIDLKKADADVPVTISVNASRTATVSADGLHLRLKDDDSNGFAVENAQNQSLLSVSGGSGNTAIKGKATINGGAAINGGVAFTGGAAISGGATINDGATVNGNGKVNGSFAVNGTATISNGATINGGATLRGWIRCTDHIALNNGNFLRLNGADDPNWAIYRGANPTEPQISKVGTNSAALRLRVYASDTEGLVVENSNNTNLLSIRGSDGEATLKGSLQIIGKSQGPAKTLSFGFLSDKYQDFTSDLFSNREYSLKTEGAVIASEFYAICDRRLKDHVADLEAGQALNAVRALRPVFFRRRPDWEQSAPDSAPTECGFYAQEVAQHVTSAISITDNEKSPDGHAFVMSHEQIGAYAVGAIQALATQTEALTAQVQSLLAVVERQAAEIAELRAAVTRE